MIFLYAWPTVPHDRSKGNPNSDSFVPINPLGPFYTLSAETKEWFQAMLRPESARLSAMPW